MSTLVDKITQLINKKSKAAEWCLVLKYCLKGDKQTMLKKLFKVFEQIGYARAAHNLALMGRHEEAKQLMMQKEAE